MSASDTAAVAAGTPIRIGVSACLLGREVRFDGGHKRNRFLTESLANFVEFVPVCPEVEAGMGVPRESVRLVRRHGEVRMIAPGSGTDHTEAMRAYCARRVFELERYDLCGYVLKSSSPSCGMERVRLYADAGGSAEAGGRGVFAAVLMRHFSELPVEDEGRLDDPALRENFVARVFAYRRLRDLFAKRWCTDDLVALHTSYKLQLLAHDPAAYRELGRLVAAAATLKPMQLQRAYRSRFMAALACMATVRRHGNVLQHIAGYFRAQLDAAERAAMDAVLEDYRAGRVPRLVPQGLMRHYARRFGVAYLEGQVYLEAHPD